MYDRASSGIPQTKQTETKAETCMQAVCRFRLLGRTGLFEGVPVFFDFSQEHMFLKQLWADWKRLLSELTGGRISRWGKDKRVRKREKYHSCVKKRRNRKEGFDGGNDSWDCAVAGDLGGTPNRCKVVWATSINSLLHLSKFLSATLLSTAVATATAHSSALQNENLRCVI